MEQENVNRKLEFEEYISNKYSGDKRSTSGVITIIKQIIEFLKYGTIPESSEPKSFRRYIKRKHFRLFDFDELGFHEFPQKSVTMVIMSVYCLSDNDDKCK